jgi:RNA polymerase subunit RPABC4/transcription elongation factor Spt4
MKAKSCFKCGAPMNSGVEVCPECRERQPVRKSFLKLLAIAFIGGILLWLAFH